MRFSLARVLLSSAMPPHSERPDPPSTTTPGHFSPSAPFIVFSFLATRSFFRPHARERRRGDFGVYVSDLSLSRRQIEPGRSEEERIMIAVQKADEEKEMSRRRITKGAGERYAPKVRQRKKETAARHDGFIFTSLRSFKAEVIIIKKGTGTTCTTRFLKRRLPARCYVNTHSCLERQLHRMRRALGSSSLMPVATGARARIFKRT